MFFLCNPPHGRGGKNRSFYVCYIISAFLSPSSSPPLSTPDVPYLPSKTLGGRTINSGLVRGITKIISMDTPPSAESAERPFLSSKRSNYPMTSKTSDDIKQNDRRGLGSIAIYGSGWIREGCAGGEWRGFWSLPLNGHFS